MNIRRPTREDQTKGERIEWQNNSLPASTIVYLPNQNKWILLRVHKKSRLVLRVFQAWCAPLETFIQPIIITLITKLRGPFNSMWGNGLTGVSEVGPKPTNFVPIKSLFPYWGGVISPWRIIHPLRRRIYRTGARASGLRFAQVFEHPYEFLR